MGNNGVNTVYTGIGAREAPANVIAIVEKIGSFMASRGYMLRSGGADGASADRSGGRQMMVWPISASCGVCGHHIF